MDDLPFFVSDFEKKCSKIEDLFVYLRPQKLLTDKTDKPHKVHI